jgi:hypothetical protein
LIALASGVALAVPVWAAAASSTGAPSTTRLERLDRVEKLEKLQKLERLEKTGKLDAAQEAKLAAMIAKTRSNTKPSNTKTGNTDVIAEAARFDAFLTANPQITAALEKNPGMINNGAIMAKYPALSAWLKDHPNVANELKTNPTEFLKVAVDMHSLTSSPEFKAMNSTGISLGELARFDLFLISNPNITKELKSNPSLISNSTFMANNPALSAWLTAHPDVAKELQTNPQVFLRLSADLYAQLNTLGLVSLL